MRSFTESNLNSQATWAGAKNQMAGTTIRETTFSLNVYSSAPSQNKFGWLSTVLTVFDESTKMPIKQST